MIRQPFSILHIFGDALQIALFRKEDDIRSDADAMKMIGAKKSAGLHQVHGNRVIIVRDQSDRTEHADGMITDVPGLALSVRWADCQNFVVYDPKKKILGVMHVGWKCLVAGTIPEFFRVLKRQFGIKGDDVFVGAGPSLCLKCSGFSDPLNEISNVPHEFVYEKNVDLQGWATKQLMDAGVGPDRFERHPDCTRCFPEKYWTYRGGHRQEVLDGHTNMLTAFMAS